jgi:sec-independent protein translocase protein TatA
MPVTRRRCSDGRSVCYELLKKRKWAFGRLTVGSTLVSVPNIGFTEMLLLVGVLLLVFGPKRLPEMGRSLGRGLREFKESVSGHSLDDDEEVPVEPSDLEEVATTPEEPASVGSGAKGPNA